jgi:hypothetical protein
MFISSLVVFWIFVFQSVACSLCEAAWARTEAERNSRRVGVVAGIGSASCRDGSPCARCRGRDMMQVLLAAGRPIPAALRRAAVIFALVDFRRQLWPVLPSSSIAHF